MQFINGSYTTYLNIQKKRTGHLFQGRYKAILVDQNNYLLELSRYVHLNPVRAKMVFKPEEYPYSSYRSYITGQSESIVSTDTILRMSAAKRSEAAVSYRDFVERAIGEEMANPLQKVYGGMILGDRMFIREALQRVQSERVKSQETSYRKSVRSGLDLEDIMSACCEHFCVAREELIGHRRGLARKTFIHLAKKYTPATNRDIAEKFGTLTCSAVAKINENVAKQLEANEELRRHIERLEAEFSIFKG